mgnify:FL=1
MDRQKSNPRGNLAAAIRARIQPFGGVDLSLPPREVARNPVAFAWFEGDEELGGSEVRAPGKTGPRASRGLGPAQNKDTPS